MSKKQTAAVAKDASPQLVETVRAIIADADDRHTYSVSKVFGAYNEALGKNDKPETCASCLKLRVEELKKWLKAAPKTATAKTTADATAKAGTPAPEEVTYDSVKERLGLQFGDTPEGEYATLGTVLDESNPLTITDAEREVVQSRYDEIYESNRQYDAPGAAFHVAPGEGVTRHPMAEGLPLDFLPGTEDVNKGTIKYADGSKVPAGTVATNAGTTFVIQANGKARIETEDLT